MPFFSGFCLRRRSVVTAAVAMSALLCAETAKAQVTNYTIQGVFTGASRGDAALQGAINPVLRADTFFSVLLSIDASVGGAPYSPEGTIFRAVSNASSSFGAFSSAQDECTSTSDFICTVRLLNSPGSSGTGFDQFLLLSGIGNSELFQREVSEARELSFQFIFFNDFFSNIFDSELVIPDLRTLALSGDFAVFAPAANPNPQFFDSANFGLVVTSITLQQVVPEPSAYMLLAAGLAGLGVIARRRRVQSAIQHQGVRVLGFEVGQGL